MTERLRIQKQMSHVQEDFPFLAQYLAGWPASTHGTQVLGLAEMKAKELITGQSNERIYSASPSVIKRDEANSQRKEESQPTREIDPQVSRQDLEKPADLGRTRKPLDLSGLSFEE